MNRQFWQALSAALAPQAAALDEMGDFPRQAAVMALITDAPSPELIFAQRSRHPSHHAGEVCFPGGMWEPQDKSLLTTALRETHEEIGLPSAMVEVLGALPMRPTRAGTLVRPFVGRIPAGSRFSLNQYELDELFAVPLVEFKRGLQVRTDVFEHHGQRVRIPAYIYQGFEIWGFTAGVTAELLLLVPPLVGDGV